MAYYSNWLRNFDEVFKYDIDKDRGWKREFGTTFDEDALETADNSSKENTVGAQTNGNVFSTEEPAGKGELPMYGIEAVKESMCCGVEEVNEETQNSSSEELEASTYHSCHSENLDENAEGARDSDAKESLVRDEYGSEDDFLGSEEEEQLRRFVREYKKNVDFSTVFSSYIWMLNRKFDQH